MRVPVALIEGAEFPDPLTLSTADGVGDLGDGEGLRLNQLRPRQADQARQYSPQPDPKPQMPAPSQSNLSPRSHVHSPSS